MSQVFRQGKLRLQLGAAARIDSRITFGAVTASAIFFCTDWASLGWVLTIIAFLLFNPFTPRGWIAFFLTLWSGAAFFCFHFVSKQVGGTDWLRAAIIGLPVLGDLLKASKSQSNLSSDVSTFFTVATQLGIAALVIKLVFNSCDRAEIFEYSKCLSPRLKVWMQPITTGWIMFYLFSRGLFPQIHENLVIRGFWPSQQRCPFYRLPVVGFPVSLGDCIFRQFTFLYLPAFLSTCVMIGFDRAQSLIIAATTRLHSDRSFSGLYLSEHNRLHDAALGLAAVLVIVVAALDYIPKVF